MTRGRRAALLVLLLSLAAAVAGVATWMVRVRERDEPPAPVAYISANWPQYRVAPGHRLHVLELKLQCTACHRAKDGGADHPAPTVCAGCHEEQAKITHGLGTRNMAATQTDQAQPSAAQHPGLSTCVDCHGFGPEPDRSPKDCLRCHQSAQGEVHAVVTHATADCTECHAVHENKIEPKACTDCHTVKLRHGNAVGPNVEGPRPSQSPHSEANVAGQCRACHDVHAEAQTAVGQCTTCHAETAASHGVPRTAVFAGGHTCDSCHAPHDFDGAHTKACTSCHQGVHPLQGHAQSGCTSCHDAHAVRDKLQGGAVCVTCHTDVALVHAASTSPAADTCLGCHAAHPAKAAQGPEACTSCHQDIGGPTHTAHAKELTCTGCHTPHGFQLEMGLALCTKCHAEKVSALQKGKEHDACTSCHQDLPHGFGTAPQACGACHSKVKSKVSEGHAQCIQCHEPHQPKADPLSCSQCHQQQAELHPRGHDKCVQCHDQHSGEEKPGVSDCTSCHKKKKLMALHNEPKHLVNGCLQCHSAHGADVPGSRQMCLSCHEDRVDHQPEAKRCDGCHAFIGSQAVGGLP